MRVLTILFFSLCLFVAASAQKPKPKPTPAKVRTVVAKPKSSAAKRPDENSGWQKAVAASDTAERIVAVRKFVAKFPRSARRSEAAEMLVTLGAALGNEKLQAGDAASAAEIFLAAVKDASKTIPEQSWTQLAKFPANLYFRGLRAEAFEIAKILEDKSASNAGQMLEIATFYLSVENGSEAKRIAEKVIASAPTSTAAYQTLGLAHRMDFNLEESAAAYAKALELDAESISAKRGLAEMKRSLGKADEAVALYREILTKDEANIPTRTGLILSLFDAEKRAEAEAELTKALEATPNNVILAAGAAYWYAVHNEGERAVELAQKAVAADPRFIWSHIALARGFLSQKKPIEAEKTLLAARQYGNFPTLEYEIASARLAAGFYREAADELAKNFTVKGGAVRTKLGGRVERSSANITELVGYERRASIFAPTAADDPEMAARLTALLELKQELDKTEPRSEIASKAVDEFVKGSDAMKVHRQIFAAGELAEKKIALPKAVELANAATVNVDAGLEVPHASSAVLASELYERRSVAAIRNEYLNVPAVPKAVLGNIVRGRIDDIAGWAAFQMNDAGEAVVRLKRALSVLPADSAWWRSSSWRLASALAAAGNEKDALEMYIKSYRSSGPSTFRYTIIETLYKKVNGSTDGLEAQIGPDPSPPVSTEPVAKVETTPEPTPEVRVESTPETVMSVPEPTPQNIPSEAPIKVEATPKDITPGVSVATPSPTLIPETTPTESATPLPAEPSPTPADKPTPATKELFPPVVITIPTPDTSKSVTKETGVRADPTPTETPVATPTPTVEPTATPTPTPEQTVPEARPRIINPNPEVNRCRLTVSEESITLQSGGGDLAVIVGLENDGDLEGLTAVSTSPDDVSVRRENIAGVKSRALFVLRAVSTKTGIYQVRFEMPCGKREIVVRVK